MPSGTHRLPRARTPHSRSSPAVVRAACFVILASLTHAQAAQTSPAQSPASPTPLDTLLDRLQDHITVFRRTVPNLSCAEHARSERLEPQTTTHSSSESVFRLRRKTESGEIGFFDESRIIESVDGHPPAGADSQIAGPDLVFGIFSNGLNTVSRSGEACFRFRLRAQTPTGIVVDFSNRPARDRGPDCPPFEQTSGRATIDPATLHVRRMEQHYPDHELLPGIRGVWDWSADYAPVTLNNRLFWMPTTIHSRSRSLSNPFDRLEHHTANASFDHVYTWTFDATYTDYHLFRTQSRIVPASP